MAIASNGGLQELINGLISISPNPTNGSSQLNSKIELHNVKVISAMGQDLVFNFPLNNSYTAF